jgi:proteasome lid subunit RPN8/RPN11
MVLRIAKSELDELRRHGEESYPQECCGVLLGEMAEDGVKAVRAIVACRNTRTDSPQNRYHIDPRELVRIQREASEQGRDLIGFYHSHPDSPARWSQNDLEEAHWTGCSYVITGVRDGQAAETSSFELVGEEENKRFDEEEIRVEG